MNKLATDTAASEDDIAQAVRIATRQWRRQGVRPHDASRLQRELTGDLQDAAASGVTVRHVLGEDIARAAGDIAVEQDADGLAARYGPFITACLLAGLLSWAPVILLLAAEFSNGSGTAWDNPYVYYGASGLLSYVLISFGAEFALTQVHDRRARQTRTALFKALPVVAALTALTGCGLAAAQGFETRPAVFVSTAIAVPIVFVGGCLTTRWLTVRASERSTLTQTSSVDRSISL